MKTKENITIQEQKIASESQKVINKILQKYSTKENKSFFIHFENEKDEIEIPYIVLKATLNYINVILTSQNKEITTQILADMLNVSRPYVVKLLENGEIPYKKVGKHRRIMYDDALIYKEKQQNERLKNLEILAQQAQEFNLGY